MKSPKLKSAANSTNPRQVRFQNDSSGHGASFPITLETETSAAPAFSGPEGDHSEDVGVFIHTSTNPSASVNLGHHFPAALPHFGQTPHQHISPFIPHNSTHHVNELSNFAPFGKYNPYGLQAPHYANMADYQNAAPPAGGLHFQPPVPDTTHGVIQHVYVPRFDNGIPSGTVYQQQPANNITYIGQVPQNPQFVMAQQPVIQPGMAMPGQPIMLQAPPVAVNPPMFQSAPSMGLQMPGGGGIPVFAGNAHLPPDVTGFGRTAGEIALEQAQFAHANGLFEPQDFKPADDDPSRYYPVREVDGNWTQRNRFTIDNLGDCRWYITNEGYFYAVPIKPSRCQGMTISDDDAIQAYFVLRVHASPSKPVRKHFIFTTQFTKETGTTKVSP
ncbi:uncharacterized protein GLRG_08464 [Colletotrichum graminicola M1.001]|uniref:Uncharacterized protein n=1 Tax=Colletotrichum graminicola (strain M1.001 / M2 / FGSC 10212) TaxID=645133 RepID=E3QR32_COLGM|nr:uncharacterized protein GLRG_08464 [Colletotrichum graminicola M1.001]EFQ33320.1 hypothetical protein GLRG_08464 [Colletotrichum graminicola M1.001]